jgi:hypothetical protein
MKHPQSRKRRSRMRINGGFMNLQDHHIAEIKIFCEVRCIRRYEDGHDYLLEQILKIQKMFGYMFEPFAHGLDEITHNGAQTVTSQNGRMTALK